MRILHIDDDADDRELFLAAIKRVDPTILHLEASDGVEAYAMLLSDAVEHIDCIFLDINMPLLDGISLLRLLKDHPKLRTIPVYVHSTTGDAKEINCIERLGGYFVQKGYDFKAYVISLRRILEPRIRETITKVEKYTRYLGGSMSLARH